jgi:putative Mn2+ efflux pump MntP
MDLLSIILIATALAMDAFSVSISAGIIIKDPDFRHYFRLSFHFGFFQFIMPIIGYFAGIYIEAYISNYDHWIAFALLVFIGIKMIRESFSREEKDINRKDPSRGINLILLAIATSIDALAVGFSIGVLNKPILFPSIIIGITCSLFSIIGIRIGRKISFISKRAEIIGGAMLVLIGIKILIEHLK